MMDLHRTWSGDRSMRQIKKSQIAGVGLLVLVGALSLLLQGEGSVGPAANADSPIDLRSCGLTAGPKDRVVSVVDGDTVVLSDGSEVRLVGIQAPKLPLGRKNFPTWPLADDAKRHLEGLLLHKDVQLFFGQNRGDRHGRILAHLKTLETDQQGIWAQGQMLRSGLARVYTFSDNRKCVQPLLARERSARGEDLAIWGHGYYDIRKPFETGRYLDTFQVVEGRVLDTAEVSSGVYLNFGENWREDFTIFVSKSNLRKFEGGANALVSLKGQRIRTRGWLKLRNGPMIDLTHPEQLEMVSG